MAFSCSAPGSLPLSWSSARWLSPFPPSSALSPPCPPALTGVSSRTPLSRAVLFLICNHSLRPHVLFTPGSLLSQEPSSGCLCASNVEGSTWVWQGSPATGSHQDHVPCHRLQGTELACTLPGHDGGRGGCGCGRDVTWGRSWKTGEAHAGGRRRPSETCRWTEAWSACPHRWCGMRRPLSSCCSLNTGPRALHNVGAPSG